MVNDWQRFDTNDKATWPHTGSTVLAWGKQYPGNSEYWFEAEFHTAGKDGWCFEFDHGTRDASAVTHWMLPAPPSAAQDTVRVPREFLQEAFDHIDVWDSDMSVWMDKALQYLTQEGKAKE